MPSTNPWIIHVKQFAKDNGISYMDAIKKARPSYKASPASEKPEKPEKSEKPAKSKKSKKPAKKSK